MGTTSVDPEEMRAAARRLQVFKETFSADLSQYHERVFEHLGSFGDDPPGRQMLGNYELMGTPLWENSGNFEIAVGRMGLSATHSAESWEQTLAMGQAPPETRPPAGAPAPADDVPVKGPKR
jgi:hypothetical protein